ncbi:TetR/AcrR family transcriptional regulator [Kitasatospora sp. NPDC058032]|uniref:TetR/AcrR family transcriptional regulator n=1 Tax=Kitasatospora sp. NPDC058032 TaxID=3346307 RepID=UPI0036DE17A0
MTTSGAGARAGARAGTATAGGYAKGRARRAAIIHSAAEHFAQRGFRAVTILDLAAACDISRAGLLRYFPDKDALLQAVLEDRDRLDRERFRPYTRLGGGLGVLRGIVDLAGHNELTPGLIELFVRLSGEASDPEHPAHAYFAERYDRIRRGTAHALREAGEAGHLRAGTDPGDAAVRLTALMDGLQTQWLFDRSVEMARHVREAVLALLNERGAAAFEALTPPALPD